MASISAYPRLAPAPRDVEIPPLGHAATPPGSGRELGWAHQGRGHLDAPHLASAGQVLMGDGPPGLHPGAGRATPHSHGASATRASWHSACRPRIPIMPAGRGAEPARRRRGSSGSGAGCPSPRTSRLDGWVGGWGGRQAHPKPDERSQKWLLGKRQAAERGAGSVLCKRPDKGLTIMRVGCLPTFSMR